MSARTWLDMNNIFVQCTMYINYMWYTCTVPVKNLQHIFQVYILHTTCTYAHNCLEINISYRS